MGAVSSCLHQFLRFFHPSNQPEPAASEPSHRDHYQLEERQRRASITEANDTEIGVGGIPSPLALSNQAYSRPLPNQTNLSQTLDLPIVSASLSPSQPCAGRQAHCAHLFALIIGIDDYANGRNLRGAVADAQAIKKFLKSTLQVPEDNILTMYNNEATREAIIKAFRNLRSDQRIRNGDPIVIFFAGHGGELPTPRGWGSQSVIQCLLPQDYSDTNVIPDRTIGALIEDIATEKGDNITVIFDCCHSTSGTRGDIAMDSDYVSRAVPLPGVTISASLDHDIWSNCSRAGSISSGFVHHGLRSHVLLAACGERETAYEHRGRGQFTNALLKMLEGRDVNDFTYTQLLQDIHLAKQNPHCEGIHRHRVLFDGKVHKRVQHAVQIQNSNQYVIAAGRAHGISEGVEFSLYNDQNKKLYAVEVDNTSIIGDFETTIMIPVRSPNASFAKLTRVGKLPLFLSSGGILSSDVLGIDPKQIYLVAADEAKLGMEMENDRIVFKILDEQVKKLGLTKLPHTAQLDNIAHVLASAAHFYWFLGLKKEYHLIGNEVAVGFYSLQKEFDADGPQILSPVEPGYCRYDSVNSPLIDFVADPDPDALYGIKIVNKTPWDLYLNVFLFNTCDLSIVPWHTQSSAGNPEPPLRKQGTFTIGYGSGGAPTLSFTLDEGQDIDVVHLKIFFATRPCDLSDVGQGSAFSCLTARNLPDGGARPAKLNLVSDKQPLESAHTWFTLDIPVVLRRK